MTNFSQNQPSKHFQEFYATLIKHDPLLEEINHEDAFYELKIISHFANRYLSISHDLSVIDVIPDSLSGYAQLLNAYMIGCDTELELMKRLRHFRHQIIILIANFQIDSVRNSTGYDDKVYETNTEKVLLMLSMLADALIIYVSDWVYEKTAIEIGTPTNKQGKIQPFIVLAMGKLGGRELNFSSDIDLIFTYPEAGETQHLNPDVVTKRNTKENSQFFQRVAQKFIKILDTVTEDGFVFRVDMRLRPLGDSGPLVTSFSALEDYYQEQGRDWERYAMVKARVVGDIDKFHAQKLDDILRPFTYRRYIDFSVIDSLRQMKALIDREVRRRDGGLDIKLSAGGIREIEFIIQVIQLIHGGRLKQLRTVSILNAFQEINALKLLDEIDLLTLKSHYFYFRRIENIIQSLNDEQTQLLPSDINNQLKLAYLMGENTFTEFLAGLTLRMQAVREIFDDLIGLTPDEFAHQTNSTEKSIEITTPLTKTNEYASNSFISYDNCIDLWEYISNGMPISEVQQKLATFTHYDEAVQALLAVTENLANFSNEIANRSIGIKGREVIQKLIPLILHKISFHGALNEVLRRTLHVLKQIVTRTTYLQLLFENQNALRHLIELCRSSTLITKRLARYPHLLGELLDAKTLFKPLAIEQYADELRQFLLRVDPGDEEEILNVLCQFKQIQQLRIAAADVSGILPTMKVSDHLTKLGEVIVAVVVDVAWDAMVKKFGLPSTLNQIEQSGAIDKRFCVVAYGKLAGWELGYRSDLDLIFLTDEIQSGVTQGNRAIDNQLFYQRLGQRVVHLLSARTNNGLLYEVDTRLRPRGESGLLVNDFESFKTYQLNEAWTYEHQALVRSRAIVGDRDLLERFIKIRHEILSQQRDVKFLRNEITEMRHKMLIQFQNNTGYEFDIKNHRFGIIDIEFIAQYLVLQYASCYPSLTIWPDNIRIFEYLKRDGLISDREETEICEIYIQMRNKIHHLSLDDKPGIVDSMTFEIEQNKIKAFWHKWLES